MTRKIYLLGFIGILAGCATTTNKSVNVPTETNQSDYIVKERNPDPAPEWIHDFAKWKRENDGKGSSYFLGESGDVNDRIAGCDIAALQAKKRIASQIAELISNKIASNKQGRLAIDPNDSNDPGIQRAFEDQVAGKSIAFLSGVKEYGNYWEHRDYSKTNGNKRVFSCVTLVVISDKDMQAALKRGSQKAQEIVEDPGAKAAVKESLKDIDKDFANYAPKSN